MIYSTKEVELNPFHPDIITVTDDWCVANRNKTQKWIKLAIWLYKDNCQVLVRKKGSNTSVYLTAIRNSRVIRVRVSNHAQDVDYIMKKSKQKIRKRFGEVALFVGPANLSARDAFQFITEIL